MPRKAKTFCALSCVSLESGRSSESSVTRSAHPRRAQSLTQSRDCSRSAVRIWPAPSQRLVVLMHLAAAGETSWHGFATEIIRGLHARGAPLKVDAIVPIATEDFPARAKRRKTRAWHSTGWSVCLELLPLEAALDAELEEMTR
jgi:dTDP-4-dehydrorhamnose reductase